MRITFRSFLMLMLTMPWVAAQARSLTKLDLDTNILHTPVHFTIHHNSNDTLHLAFRKAIMEWKRIDRMLSDEHPHSEVRRININAGFQPVKVPDEVFDIVYRAVKMAKITNGAFDITSALLEDNYDQYGHDPGNTDSILQGLLDLTGYEKIELNTKERTIFLKEKGMKISLKDMRTGYIMNQMVRILKFYNVYSGFIQLDEQVLAWGKKDQNKDWIAEVPDPITGNNSLKLINSNNLAVFSKKIVSEKRMVTESYRILGLHPLTGTPVQDISGVTIVCRDAEIANVVAYSVSILGIDQGMKLINLLDGVEGIIIDMNGKEFASNQIEQYFVPWVKN